MADYRELFRTAPGTQGGQYMRLFWHPVCRSVDLKPGWAKPIQVMSDKFTLYRGEGGAAHVVAFRCAHRGLQLSVGWVENDCIRCRYHGWKYDGNGQCVEVPTEDQSTANSIRIKTYPTREYLGFVFAYFGDNEAPALPHYPDYEKGEIWTETYERPCNFFNNLENDPVHIPFAHRESEIFRTRPIDVPVKVQAEESDWGITLHTTYSGDRLRTTQFGWPNIRSFKAPDRNHLVWRVPIDDVSHASFQLDVMHVTNGDQGEFYKQRHAARTGKIGSSYKDLGEAILRGELRIQDIDGDDKANLIWIQDYVTQVGLGTFADRVNERLIRSDSGVLLYRKIWERELRALSENNPLKQWGRSERLMNAYSYHTSQ